MCLEGGFAENGVCPLTERLMHPDDEDLDVSIVDEIKSGYPAWSDLSLLCALAAAAVAAQRARSNVQVNLAATCSWVWLGRSIWLWISSII